jgi:antitoxin (DNA-binding transcriptional repressor) of toxin-antitoxin stability system
MKTISMLQFRRNAEGIIAQICRGQRLILTYRGRAVARLEPIAAPAVHNDDPFYSLDALADTKGRSLSNEQMDRIIYGA